MLQAPLLPAGSPRRASREGGSASVGSSIINLASTCMGTGLLALPAAFHAAGFTMGCILCVGCAGLTILSLYLLALGGARVDGPGPVTFYTLCEKVAPGSGRLVDCAVVVNCVGTAASYLIVACDCFSALGVDRHLVALASVLACAPACHFQSVNSLRVTSSLAVGCLLGIAVMVVLFGFGEAGSALDPCPGRSAVPHGHCGSSLTMTATKPRRIWCALPLFINAFTCQQNAFNVLGELSRPTHDRQMAVIAGAPLLPMVIYLLVASCGYLTFGDGVASSVMNNYPNTPITAAARSVLGVVVLCNYPLQIFPSRVSLASLYHSLQSCTPPHPPPPTAGGGGAGVHPFNLFAPPPQGSRNAGAVLARELRASSAEKAEAASIFVTSRLDKVLVGALLFVTTAIALCVNNLGVVVAVVGSSGATFIGLITPAAAHLLEQHASAHRLKPIDLQNLLVLALAALLLLVGLAVVPSLVFCGGA